MIVCVVPYNAFTVVYLMAKGSLHVCGCMRMCVRRKAVFILMVTFIGDEGIMKWLKHMMQRKYLGVVESCNGPG